MKKFLAIAAVLLLVAGPVLAGSYTVTTSAGDDTRLGKQVTRINARTCAAAGLAPG